MPHVHERDAFWEMKEKGEAYKKPDHYEEIHMPKKQRCRYRHCSFLHHLRFRHDLAYLVAGDCWLRRHDHHRIVKSFDEDVDYYVPVAEIEKLENQHFDEITKAGLKNGN